MLLFCSGRGGGHPRCSWCCSNYSVVWGIFGLTFCIPFAGWGDWNKSKHYGLAMWPAYCSGCIRLGLYLAVLYYLIIAGLHLTHCCVCTIFMCFIQPCAVMQEMFWKCKNFYRSCRAKCLLFVTACAWKHGACMNSVGLASRCMMYRTHTHWGLQRCTKMQ